MLSHPERVAGRRVLVLGAGAGLDALAAARLGAARVLACDVRRLEDAQPLLRAASSLPPPLHGVLHAAGVLDDGMVCWTAISRGPPYIFALHRSARLPVLRPVTSSAWGSMTGPFYRRRCAFTPFR